VAFPVYLDENAQASVLVQLLREAAVDCQTANEARLNGADDSDVLAHATSNGRTVITHDREDFQRLHGQWMGTGRDHTGIVVITNSRMSLSAIAERILHLQAGRDIERMRNAILYIGPSTTA
jgi:predicted nuclease of predicted toxin-antitoxin system